MILPSFAKEWFYFVTFFAAETYLEQQEEIFMENPGNLTYIFFVIIALIGLVGAIVFFNFFAIWLRALTSGAKVSYTELIALRLRGVPVGPVVNVRITAIKSGLPLSIDELSTHFLAGGNIEAVVQALIAARKANIYLEFDSACAIDLATK
ncbi:MAG: flotillin-like FloA family protein, partial [Verrucomicrobiota bacterium]|nr:flotillin-like FloA family protein [Verrucomicrobiota bacterium]